MLRTVDFEKDAIGTWTFAACKADFGTVDWEDGISEGHASIVQDADASRGKVLKVGNTSKFFPSSSVETLLLQAAELA